jgi:hypothetical protein
MATTCGACDRCLRTCQHDGCKESICETCDHIGRRYCKSHGRDCGSCGWYYETRKLEDCGCTTPHPATKQLFCPACLTKCSKCHIKKADCCMVQPIHVNRANLCRTCAGLSPRADIPESVVCISCGRKQEAPILYMQFPNGNGAICGMCHVNCKKLVKQ